MTPCCHAAAGGVPVAEIRDGVGIDRRTGAASDRIKFDRAVLPAGTRLPLHLVVEVIDDGAANIEATVGHLIDALVNGEIGFGAARTRGLGEVKLEGPTVHRETFDRAGMLAILNARAEGAQAGTATNSDELKAKQSTLKPEVLPGLKATVHWSPIGPLMVRAGTDGLAVDSLPLVTMSETGVRPLLPGGSVKGVLRSHAERLVRTVQGTSAGSRRRPQGATCRRAGRRPVRNGPARGPS